MAAMRIIIFPNTVIKRTVTLDAVLPRNKANETKCPKSVYREQTDFWLITGYSHTENAAVVATGSCTRGVVREENFDIKHELRGGGSTMRFFSPARGLADDRR